MTEVQHKAQATWDGDLERGSGRVTRGSRPEEGEKLTFKRRVGSAGGGVTSPEELIAAAHAGCFSMALSNVLDARGHEPEHIDVHATCSLDTDGGQLRISGIDLDVAACVGGIDDETFAQLVREAEAVCPVSNALRGNVRIDVSAKLEPARG